jgi:hypothetical protein
MDVRRCSWQQGVSGLTALTLARHIPTILSSKPHDKMLAPDHEKLPGKSQMTLQTTPKHFANNSDTTPKYWKIEKKDLKKVKTWRCRYKCDN